MNRFSFIGNLTRDPESRATANGATFCNFTVAVNSRRRAQAQDGQNAQEETMFIRVTVWRQLGENCQRYLSKGRKVYVSGPLRAGTYTASDGNVRISLDVTADDVEFLSPAGSTGSDGTYGASYGSSYASPSASPAAPQSPTAQNNGFEPVTAEDDLPF